MAVESLNHRVAAWLEEILSLEIDAPAPLGLSKNGSLVHIVRRLFRLAKYLRARYANKSSTSVSKQVENHYYAIGINVEERGKRVKIPLPSPLVRSVPSFTWQSGRVFSSPGNFSHLFCGSRCTADRRHTLVDSEHAAIVLNASRPRLRYVYPDRTSVLIANRHSTMGDTRGGCPQANAKYPQRQRTFRERSMCGRGYTGGSQADRCSYVIVETEVNKASSKCL